MQARNWQNWTAPRAAAANQRGTTIKQHAAQRQPLTAQDHGRAERLLRLPLAALLATCLSVSVSAAAAPAAPSPQPSPQPAEPSTQPGDAGVPTIDPSYDTQEATQDANQEGGAQSIEEALADADATHPLDNRLSGVDQQIQAGELVDAEQRLTAEIRRIETASDRYDPTLVQPLRLLGRTYKAQNNHPEAAAALARATQISRVSFGLHNAAQIEIVHEEIESLVAMGELVEANDRYEYAFQIAARAYGSFSPQIITEVLRLADWYSNTGNIFGARSHYVHARNLLSARQPSIASDEMIQALGGLAKSYRDERYPPFYSRGDSHSSELVELNEDRRPTQSLRDAHGLQISVNALNRGTEALIDIVHIYEARLAALQAQLVSPSSAAQAASHGAIDDPAVAEVEVEAQPELSNRQKRRRSRGRSATEPLLQLDRAIADPAVDVSEFLQAILDLADWYLMMDKAPRAFAYYQHAYRIATTDPTTDAAGLFAQPRLLYFPLPTDPKLPEGIAVSKAKDGYVDLTYEIDHRGNVRRLRTIASNPPGLMDYQVRRSMGISRYRPRIIDGLPQPTQQHSYRHSFNYYPRKQDAAPSTAAVPSAE